MSEPLPVDANSETHVNASGSIEEVLPNLCQRLRRRMTWILSVQRIPPQDWEDLIQTALLQAVSKWSEIRDPEAWLLATLSNRCLMYRRRRLVESCRFVELDAAVEATAASVAEQAKCDLLADLKAACRNLPPSQHLLVVCCCHLGLSPTESASATGLAHGSVRKTLSRAYARLRELLGELPRPARARASARSVRRRSPNRRPRAPAAWTAAVRTWLIEAGYTAWTSKSYRAHLSSAGLALGDRPLTELTPDALASYRTEQIQHGQARGKHMGARLQVLCTFLTWAGKCGLHGIDADNLRLALLGSQVARRCPSASRRAELGTT
jgi:RNA polymerase sigma factor (sigma-70 family)